MWRFLLAIVLLTTTAVVPAHAASYCANSVSELQTILDSAEIDNDDSLVRMAAGVYPLGSDVRYEPEFESIVAPGRLTLVGGYNSDCSAQTGTTRFTSASSKHVVFATITGSVRLADVAFDGVDLYVQDMALAHCASADRSFELDRVLVNNATFISTSLCHDVDIRDSVFANGQPYRSFSDASVAVYLATDDDYQGSSLTMVNTTVVNGITAIENCCANLPLTRIYNSIFQRAGDDIHNEGLLSIVNSRFDGIENQSGGSTLLNLDNTSAAANLDAQFVPNAGSAMVNSGTSNVPGGLSELDVHGTDRVIGPRVDRGAAESPVDGTGIYTVTTANPSGAGSLAAAITLANQDAADNVIRFNIPGNCPHRITLAGALSVNDRLRIDGYSQPGSLRNTGEFLWNAKPCILLDGSNTGGVAILTGPQLGTNAESIDVSGLAFERFDTAILLAYGVDHRVRGNQFGGEIGTTGITLRANNNAITVAGEGRSSIGGAATSDINLIGNSNESGILVTGASNYSTDVIRNMIGLDKDGLSALPNQDGLRITARESRVAGNRIAHNSRDGIALSGTVSHDNQIINNTIGYSLPPPFLSGGNGRMGVFLDNSAHDNTISSNRVGGNGDDGVRVFTDAGGRNRISGNSIVGNEGIGIDLGVNGVTGNNLSPLPACDVETGCAANASQNYPILDSVVLKPPGAYPLDRPLQIKGHLTSHVRNAPYLVEFYAGGECDASGHGQGQHLIGSKAVTVSNTGVCANDNCSAYFSVFVSDLDADIGDAITAIATSPVGDTSEYSACMVVASGDVIFADGFEVP